MRLISARRGNQNRRQSCPLQFSRSRRVGDGRTRFQPADLELIAQGLLAHPESLVQPADDSVLHAVTGCDSQTGLRGIPASFAPRILQIEANGPEFDLELMAAARRCRGASSGGTDP